MKPDIDYLAKVLGGLIQNFPDEHVDNLLYDYLEKMPGIESKLTLEMLNAVRARAMTDEYSKSEGPTSQILSPAGTCRMFEFMNKSDRRQEIYAGY